MQSSHSRFDWNTVFSALRNRKVQIAGQTVVITALVGGTAAFVGLNKQVDLTVDGETQQVRTFSDSVSDVLESNDVDVAKEDQVQPGADADVTRGMNIIVNTSKDIDLTLDGVTTQESTTGNTIAEALADLGVDPEGAEVSEDLDATLADGENSEFSVVTPKTVTVVADGDRTPVDVTAATAQDVLDEANIELGEQDTVSTPLSAPVSDGSVVEVLRTATDEKTETETIAKKVTEKNDSSLPRGEKKVETEGRDGKREIVYSVTTVNGEEVKREKKSEEVVAEAKNEVVLIGTKEPEPAPAPEDNSDEGSDDSGDAGDSGDSGESEESGESGDSGESDTGDRSPMTTAEIKAMLGGPGSKWYQVVKCESNFNPKAVNQQNNAHFGLFQFKQATWNSVGGSGNPADAHPREQFKRAKILQAQAGWGQWACA
ncbi:resuscitation-promoting factor [Brevibacterium yomogidense]|uniref:resuscitation-promoting factor n=1 Tax=Brevibacterium yomogidense TaxID=946573 RepID=UPI00211B06A3|nr:resuscitation-promoting factor [Brevibacterium yomogidense]